MEETREALVQKLLDRYPKEGNYETAIPGACSSLRTEQDSRTAHL